MLTETLQRQGRERVGFLIVPIRYRNSQRMRRRR
jgi:hypothetical protein